MGAVLRRKLETMDIVQETMIAIIRSAGCRHFESEPGFLAWIRGVVERRILHAARYWRAARRRARQEIGSGEAICTIVDTRAQRPSALVMLSEEVDRVSEHIAELRPRDREVITYRALLGLPWSMVGARLGVTEETAQMRFNRARRRLADLDASS